MAGDLGYLKTYVLCIFIYQIIALNFAMLAIHRRRLLHSKWRRKISKRLGFKVHFLCRRNINSVHTFSDRMLFVLECINVFIVERLHQLCSMYSYCNYKKIQTHSYLHY